MNHYEIHVTVPWSPVTQRKFQDLGTEYGWSTSWIDGDPNLGSGRRFYFTRHEPTYMGAMVFMEKLVWKLNQAGHVVLRRKVEQIVFDDKTPIEP